MVNWNVVSDNWQDVKVHLRNAGAEVERGWKLITRGIIRRKLIYNQIFK
jgi:hypothetical protein